MLARDLGPERAERDLLSTGPQIEEITARSPPDKILTSRLTDDVPFRTEREGAGSLILHVMRPMDACAITRLVFFSPALCARLFRTGSRYRARADAMQLKIALGIGK